MKFNREHLIIILLFSTSFFLFISNINPHFFSSDETNYFRSSMNLLEGRFNNYNNLNSEYNTCVFLDNISIFKDKNTVYPRGYLGSILVYSFFISLFGQNIFFYISPILGSFSVVLVYLITKKLFNSVIASTLSSMTLIFMPLFNHWSVSYYNTLLVIFLFLLVLYLLVLSNRNFTFLIAGFLFSLIGFIRPPDFVAGLPFVLYISVKNYKNNFIRKLIFFVIPIFLVLIVMLILNNFFYSDPLFFPNNYDSFFYSNYPCLDDFYQAEEISFLNQVLLRKSEMISLFNNFKSFLTSNFAFPFLYISILAIFILIIHKKDNSLAYFTIIMSFIYILAYGRGNSYYGYDTMTLQSSLLRWFLPIFIVLNICLAYLFFVLSKKEIMYKKVIFVLFVLLLLFSINISVNFDSYGFSNLNKIRNYGVPIKEFILTKTNNSDILIVNEPIANLVVLDRDNIIYYYNIPQSVREEEINRVIDALLSDGRNVYFIGTFYIGTKYETQSEEIMVNLQKDFKLTNIGEVRNVILFQVVEV